MAHVPMTRRDALATLKRHGFGGPLVYLLDVLPLVRMAWADGVVQPSERAEILAFVDEHLGRLDIQAQSTVVPRPVALECINRLLAVRPSEEEFDELLEALVVLRLGGERAGVRTQRILDAVTRVGSAANSPGKPDQSWDKRELITMWALQTALRVH